jgi:hypothetical protein
MGQGATPDANPDVSQERDLEALRTRMLKRRIQREALVDDERAILGFSIATDRDSAL